MNFRQTKNVANIKHPNETPSGVAGRWGGVLGGTRTVMKEQKWGHELFPDWSMFKWTNFDEHAGSYMGMLEDFDLVKIKKKSQTWYVTYFCGWSVGLLWEEREGHIWKQVHREERSLRGTETELLPMERFPIRPMNWCGRGFLVILRRISLNGLLESQPSCGGQISQWMFMVHRPRLVQSTAVETLYLNLFVKMLL